MRLELACCFGFSFLFFPISGLFLAPESLSVLTFLLWLFFFSDFYFLLLLQFFAAASSVLLIPQFPCLRFSGISFAFLSFVPELDIETTVDDDKCLPPR